MAGPTRPLLRYHGGKWRMAPWIISHFPPHRIYTEAYGGAASVLLRKPRSYSEVWNDLDEDVVTLFRVLRSDRAGELIEALRLTPFARAEFERAYEPAEDQVERSRRLLVRSYMGFGSDASTVDLAAETGFRTGFRSNSNRNHTTPAHDWANYPPQLLAMIKRLTAVVIESRPALDVLRKHDAPDALHYVDPPYMPETRSAKARRRGGSYHVYAHEMSEADHAELLEVLDGLEGAVVLSGYANGLYAERLTTWSTVSTAALADGARPRVEMLWLNPRAAAGLAQQSLPFNDPPHETDGRPAGAAGGAVHHVGR